MQRLQIINLQTYLSISYFVSDCPWCPGSLMYQWEKLNSIHLGDIYYQCLKCKVFPFKFFEEILEVVKGFPGGSKGKELACQGRRRKRHGFDSWVGRILWRRAAHSSILVWRIPWTEKPGRLKFIGLQSVRHDSSNLACTHKEGVKITGKFDK